MGLPGERQDARLNVNFSSVMNDVMGKVCPKRCMGQT
jgi:hypothetical protein